MCLVLQTIEQLTQQLTSEKAARGEAEQRLAAMEERLKTERAEADKALAGKEEEHKLVRAPPLHACMHSGTRTHAAPVPPL